MFLDKWHQMDECYTIFENLSYFKHEKLNNNIS